MVVNCSKYKQISPLFVRYRFHSYAIFIACNVTNSGGFRVIGNSIFTMLSIGDILRKNLFAESSRYN